MRRRTCRRYSFKGAGGRAGARHGSVTPGLGGGREPGEERLSAGVGHAACQSRCVGNDQEQVYLAWQAGARVSLCLPYLPPFQNSLSHGPPAFHWIGAIDPRPVSFPHGSPNLPGFPAVWGFSVVPGGRLERSPPQRSDATASTQPA